MHLQNETKGFLKKGTFGQWERTHRNENRITEIFHTGIRVEINSWGNVPEGQTKRQETMGRKRRLRKINGPILAVQLICPLERKKLKEINYQGSNIRKFPRTEEFHILDGKFPENNICKKHKIIIGYVIMNIQNPKDKDPNSLWRGKKKSLF